MEKDYLKDKSVKKKSAVKVVYLLVFFVAVFAALLAKFAISGTVNPFNGLPDSDAAYTVAKEYIKPTILSSNVIFSDSEYKYAKKSDSIYVIKSYYTAKDADGESSKTNFTITLKYNGGYDASGKNWTLVNLDQE